MNGLILCAGFLMALSSGTAQPVHAQLLGRRIVDTFPGAPILVCRYAGPAAIYEVVASTSSCAPVLNVE